MKQTILNTAAVAMTLTMTLGMGLNAQASWYEENCSNAEGTVKLAMGHNENFTAVTERVYDQGYSTDTVIKDEAGDIEFEFSGEKQLERTSSDSCLPGTEYGFASWRKVTYRIVTLKKANGGLFSKSTVGVSEDLKTVKASLLCELNGNSESICTR